MGTFSRNFKGTFNGFRTAVGKEDPLHSADVTQQFGKENLWRTDEEIGDMNQLSGLILDGLDYGRMAVTYAVYSYSCEHVNIFFAICIPYSASTALDEC